MRKTLQHYLNTEPHDNLIIRHLMISLKKSDCEVARNCNQSISVLDF